VTRDEDAEVVAAQLGRPPRGRWEVASRCALGLPVVVRAHPQLEDGAPFPTLFWLTCPLARRRVSRLEQRGDVRAWTARVAAEPALRAAFEESQAAYARERAALLPPAAPALERLRGGVGGAEGGVKCLHAHYAHARAGRANPIGAEVARQVEPLDCATPCVLAGVRAPGWREPPAPPGP
jgi:hypothetical protein